MSKLKDAEEFLNRLRRIMLQNPNENFKLYQRSGRKDLITRVPFSFIEENTVKYIMKNNWF